MIHTTLIRQRESDCGALPEICDRKQMDSDNESVEYEEWLPKVVKRWDTLIADPNRDAKKYTAFLRFVFEECDIPASVQVKARGTYDWGTYDWGMYEYVHDILYYELDILYFGAARTMKEMQGKLDMIDKIVRQFNPDQYFNMRCEYDIQYFTRSIWERDPYNSPTYFRNLMSVGKGDVPYLPSDVRKLIVGH